MNELVDPRYLAALEKYHAYYKLALAALVRKNGGTLVVELDADMEVVMENQSLRHTANTRPNGTRVMFFDLVERKK